MHQSLRTVIRSCYKDKRRLLLFALTGLFMWCQIMWLWPAAVLMDHTQLSRWTVFINSNRDNRELHNLFLAKVAVGRQFGYVALPSSTSLLYLYNRNAPKIAQDNYIRFCALINVDKKEKEGIVHNMVKNEFLVHKYGSFFLCLSPWLFFNYL